MVWDLSVKRACAMVLLMQLECEWIVLGGIGVACEACSRQVLLIQLECEWIVLDGMGVVCEVWLCHSVIDAARVRFAILTCICLIFPGENTVTTTVQVIF